MRGRTMTLSEMITLEPMLETVLLNAATIGRAARQRGQPVSLRTYESIKRRISQLVGQYRWRAHDTLSSPEAYEIAIREVARRFGI